LLAALFISMIPFVAMAAQSIKLAPRPPSVGQVTTLPLITYR